MDYHRKSILCDILNINIAIDYAKESNQEYDMIYLQHEKVCIGLYVQFYDSYGFQRMEVDFHMYFGQGCHAKEITPPN
mgnify:CR=1 FL=1